MSRRCQLSALAVAIGTLAAAATAHATYPYGVQGGPGDYNEYRLAPGDPRPNELADDIEWKFAATPEPGNELVNSDPRELFGIRGGHVADHDSSVSQAWATTTGRPDVTIAVLDSGIRWDSTGVMLDVRKKTRISRGEALQPVADRSASTEPGEDCNGYGQPGGDPWDLNGDGVFNVIDYSCDSRVDADPEHNVGPSWPSDHPAAGQPMLEPQDVLIAFSDGDDDDSNGFDDDMVGWDFLDDDNDPFDDVSYGHGSGEAQGSGGEADNGNDLGTCANCTQIHMRVGDSFIADVNRFGQAVTYAVDNDVLVVQEALGTLNNSIFARQAVEYAYDHGVTTIASAADEAAQHNNWPSSNPHVILVNSVRKYAVPQPPGPAPGKSYLQFNGCTNFNSKVTLAIPSTSCSSDATGLASGMAGLVYSAALNAIENGDLAPHPSCKLADGGPCAVSANEVRQLMASGTVGDELMADDVDFAISETSCSQARIIACTDPFGAVPDTQTREVLTSSGGRSYPARGGHDQFYGYGRINTARSVETAQEGVIPPEAELTAPDWYELIDPALESLPIQGQVGARDRPYSCRLLVAPGSYPHNSEAPEGDFAEVPSGQCNGEQRSGDYTGVVGTIDVAELKARFPDNVGNFDGREPGTGEQTANGRPNVDAYGFVVKLVVETADGGQQLTGEDRRNYRLHRDADMLDGFPADLGGDGASSPLFVDLDGDNRNELLLAGSDGLVHAYRRDRSELPGWPQRTDRLPLHREQRAYASGAVSDDFGGAVLASLAAVDMDRDGIPEVVAADLEGKVYAWSAAGERLFTREANIAFSGKPLAPFENVRQGKRHRTQHGFIGSPVLADLDRDDGGRLEVVAASMDRHVYAWNHDGSPVPGFPALVVDRGKVASIDPTTHRVNFDEAAAGPAEEQGAIIVTPAVGDIAGDPRPEIVVGTNEEYVVNTGNEGPHNVSSFRNFTTPVLGGRLGLANTRLYALTAEGDADGDPATAPSQVAGWPIKLAQVGTSTLPVVGEGVTGSPAIGPITCAIQGGAGAKVVAAAHAGPVFVFNPDTSSCYGEEAGRPIPLQTEFTTGAERFDAPVLNAFGHPAVGDFGDGASVLTAGLGARRALDIALPEYQDGQDFVGVWNGATGEMRPNFPAVVNDLQFLTGPSVADLDGLPGEEFVSGTASLDLQAFNAAGAPVGPGWPKLTSDWVVANPLIGSWGEREVEAGARKVIFEITRSGFMLAYGTEAPACSPSSWPRFHHDNANSGDARRDAVSPGRPENARVVGDELRFLAPGDDLLCGPADSYELAHSDEPIDGRNIDDAEQLPAPEPGAPGSEQSAPLPADVKRYVGLRAVDEQGNVGRTVSVDRGPGGGPGGGGPGGGGPGGSPGDRSARPCLPRRLRVTSRRIGPARIGARIRPLTRSRRVANRGRTAIRLCVRGGGRFLVKARRGRISFVATTAPGHRTRATAPRRRATRRALAGTRRLRPDLYVSRRGRNRLLMGTRRGRIAYLAVAPRPTALRELRLARQLRQLGLRR